MYPKVARNSMKKSLLHAAGLLLMACLMMTCFTSCSSKKVIVNALSEKEANEILVYLSTRGIHAEKQQTVSTGPGAGQTVLWDVAVDASQSTEALSLLNQSGLPRRQGQKLLEIFSGGGLVPSELEERIRFQQGLGQQIANTIRSIDGVLDAQVNLSFPDSDPLKPDSEKKDKITASVYVKHSGVLDDPNSHLITKIKRLVQSSVSGLNYDKVTVVGDRARFGDLPLGYESSFGEDKEFVNIWTVIVAKESATRFRGIFFSFLIIILLLVVTVSWIIWKVTPLFQKHGGLGKLFSLAPLYGPPKEKTVKEGDTSEKGTEETADEEETEEAPPKDVT